MPTTLLKLKDVLARVPYKKSHLYAKIKSGSFPQQVHLGGRGAFWVDEEIEQWVRTEIAPSVSGNPTPLTPPEKAGVFTGTFTDIHP